SPEGPEVVERPAEIMRAPFAEALPERATTLVVGPGLGLDEHAARALALTLADARPQVLDADALNLVARDLRLAELAHSAAPRILTPHPLEAARLLGTTRDAVQ